VASDIVISCRGLKLSRTAAEPILQNSDRTCRPGSGRGSSRQRPRELARAARKRRVTFAQLSDGTLPYAIGVAPANQFDSYRDVFDRIVSSIRAIER